MNDVFDQIRTIAEEVLKAPNKYALVLECVTEIFSLVLKICNDTSEEPRHRFSKSSAAYSHFPLATSKFRL